MKLGRLMLRRCGVAIYFGLGAVVASTVMCIVAWQEQRMDLSALLAEWTQLSTDLFVFAVLAGLAVAAVSVLVDATWPARWQFGIDRRDLLSQYLR